MSSLSRTFARANRSIMKTYQGPGAYQLAEQQYNESLDKKRDKRAIRKREEETKNE